MTWPVLSDGVEGSSLFAFEGSNVIMDGESETPVDSTSLSQYIHLRPKYTATLNFHLISSGIRLSYDPYQRRYRCV